MKKFSESRRSIVMQIWIALLFVIVNIKSQLTSFFEFSFLDFSIFVLSRLNVRFINIRFVKLASSVEALKINREIDVTYEDCKQSCALDM